MLLIFVLIFIYLYVEICQTIQRWDQLVNYILFCLVLHRWCCVSSSRNVCRNSQSIFIGYCHWYHICQYHTIALIFLNNHRSFAHCFARGRSCCFPRCAFRSTGVRVHRFTFWISSIFILFSHSYFSATLTSSS